MVARLFVFASVLIVALPGTAATTGVVMNSDGQTIADARVAAYALEDSAARRLRLLSDAPERTPLATAVTDTRGRFSLDTPKEHPVIALQIEATGYAPYATRLERDDDLGAVGLTRAERKTGRITASGKPVAGARVVWSHTAEIIRTTDETGRYSVPDPSAWATRVLVLHPQYARYEHVGGPGATDDAIPDRSLDRGITISGRVVTSDGKSPVAGASLVVDGWPAGTSAEDGTFALNRIPQRWTWLEAFTNEAGGAVTRGRESTIRVKPLATVRGTARDVKTGEPIAGADVALVRGGRAAGRPLESTITDANGSFTVANVWPGMYRLHAHHIGYFFLPTSANATLRATRDVTVSGTSRARVAGTVIDEKKQPVSGALVNAHRAMMPLSPATILVGNAVATAPDGSFRLYADPEVDVQVFALRKGFPLARSATLRLAPGERKTGVLLTIPAGVAVSGRVLDVDGNPISGVEVLSAETRAQGSGWPGFSSAGPRRRDDAIVRTGADGSFSLRLQQGVYDIAFRRDGFAPKIVRAHQVKPRVAPLAVVLEPAVEITGRVVRAGSGVAGVRVSVVDDLLQANVETGPEGSFRIDNLPAGSLRLKLTTIDDLIGVERTVRAPANDITIELPAGGRVSGRVIDKATKQPVTSFEAGFSGVRSVKSTVGSMSQGGPPQLRSFSSDDGTFVLENVPSGSVGIAAIAPGYAMSEVSNVAVEEGKEVSGIEIALERGVRLRGRVTDSSGAPLAGVIVHVLLESGGSRRSSPTSMAASDSNGEYVIEAAEPGRRPVMFARRGYVHVEKTVEINAPETRVDAELSTGVSATGIVVDENGRPVADASVHASLGFRGGVNPTRSDQNGEFRLDGLAPGRYVFRAQKYGYIQAEARDVDVSTAVPVRLVLGTGGVIFGRILGLGPEEFSSVTVTAHAPPGHSASAPVDSSGNFRIEGAPLGTVRVYARAGAGFFGDARFSANESVEVIAGAPAQVDIEFHSGAATVSGRITRNGEPAPGARVTFAPRDVHGQGSASGHADTQGIYEVRGLRDGTYNVFVGTSGASGFNTTYVVRGSGTFDIDMRTSRLTGHVIDATSGQPIANANVTLRRKGGAPVPVEGVRTDSAGIFTMPHVMAGEYQVTAALAGYGAKSVDVAVTDAPAEVTLRLAPAEGIVVRVVDSRDGRPIPASVRVRDSDNRVVYDGFGGAGPADTHTLGLDPGPYRIVVNAPGYAPKNLEVNSPGSYTVAMSPGGTLVIRSKAAERRSVRLIAPDGQPYMRAFAGRVFTLDRSPAVRRLTDIEPGVYTLQIVGSGDQVISSIQIVITGGGSTEIDI